MSEAVKLSRKERQARAEKLRQEVCDTIIAVIKTGLHSGLSFKASCENGDDVLNRLLKEDPKNKVVIRGGAVRAYSLLEDKLEEGKVNGN